jgi:hypothetical protein
MMTEEEDQEVETATYTTEAIVEAEVVVLVVRQVVVVVVVVTATSSPCRQAQGSVVPARPRSASQHQTSRTWRLFWTGRED